MKFVTAIIDAIRNTLLGRTIAFMVVVITSAFLCMAFILLHLGGGEIRLTSNNYFAIPVVFFYAFAAGIVTSLFLGLLFYRNIIIRIETLTKKLVKLREQEDADPEVQVPGTDELSQLSSDIKRLLTVKRITEKALRESENLYKTVFNSSHDALLLTDSSHRIISFNKRFTELTGELPDETPGKKFPFDFIEPNNYGFYQKLEDGNPQGGYTGAEAILRNISGKEYECAVTSSAVQIKDDTCFLIRIADITEAKDLERQKRERQMQLQQSDKLASLGLLVAGVAHEINNPNSFILFNIPYIEKSLKEIFQIIESSNKDTSGIKVGSLPYERFKNEMGDVISDMHEGAERITNIIKDLKNIARSEPEEEREKFPLKETILGVLRLLNPSMSKKQIIAEVEIPEGVILAGGRAKLSQALINLITNSIEAIEGTGGRIRIGLKQRSQDKRVLEISDTGGGIKADAQLKIFEPFFTTKSGTGGTGLGLPLTRTLLAGLGYSIDVKSKQGAGTTVSIIIPEQLIRNGTADEDNTHKETK